MRKYRIITMLSVLFALFMTITVSAYEEYPTVASGATSDGFYWQLDENGMLTFTGSGESMSYGESFDTMTGEQSYDTPWYSYRDIIFGVTISEGITYIGDYTFAGLYLQSVHIPESLENCSGSAFGYNYIENLYVPSLEYWLNTNVNVGKYNLYVNNELLTKVIIPEGITSIRNDAFEFCTSITEVTIPEGVENIGDHAFWDCDALTEMTLPQSVKTIGNYVFADCDKLKNVNLNNGLESIDFRAFYNCNALTEITIPDTVTSLGEGLFDSCTNLKSVNFGKCTANISAGLFPSCTALQAINVSEDNVKYTSADGVLFSRDMTELLYYPITRQDTEYTVPDGVKIIGESVFASSEALTKITLPQSLTTIGNYAFYYCQNLAEINIPVDVTTIGNSAFYYCSALEEITIPDKATAIESGTFSGCRALNSITLGSGIEKIDSYAFNSCTSLTEITIPDSVTDINYNAFYNCYNISVINIGKGIKDITYSFFDDLTGLTAINVGEDNENYTSDDGVLFSKDEATLIKYPKNKADEAYTVPEYVTLIGERAFSGNKNLKAISIDGTEPKLRIGNYAFKGCTALADFGSFETVIEIGGYAFLGTAYYNNEENWANNMLYVGDYSKWLVAVNYPRVEEYDYNYGYYKEKDEYKYTAYMDYDCVGIAAGVFSGRDGLTKVSLPDSLIYIGDSAFGGCLRLESVDIPDSVTYVGESAFYNCYKMTHAKIGRGVKILNNSLFGIDSYYDYGMGTDIEKRDGILVTICGIPEKIENAFDDNYSNVIFFLGSEEEWNSIEGHGNVRGTVLFDAPDTGFAIIDGGNLGNGLTWALDEGGTLYICGNGGMSSEHGYYPPWRIDEQGYISYENDDKITNVVIGDGVTSVNHYAFNYTAFYENKANWKDGFLYASGWLLGYDYYAEMPEVVTIDGDCKGIASYAFFFNEVIKEMTFGDSVTTLCDYAFAEMRALEVINIGQNVSLVGNNHSFGYNVPKLEKINVDSENQYYTSQDGVLFNKDKTTLIRYPQGKKDSAYVIPDSVIRLSDYAFYKAALESVKVPYGVTYMGNYAFYDCESLKTIYLPGMIENYGSYVLGITYTNEKNIYYPGTKECWDANFNENPYGVTMHFEYPCDKVTREGNTISATFKNFGKAEGDMLVLGIYKDGTLLRLETKTVKEGETEDIVLSDNSFKEGETAVIMAFDVNLKPYFLKSEMKFE